MNRIRRLRVGASAALIVAVLAACGGDGGGSAADAGSTTANGDAATSSTGGAALTPEQMEKGIGPIREIQLGPVDEALAERGEEAFKTLCYACHRMDQRYVAPQLGNVLERRTPEYVMNMILNPAEMLERHPTARALLAEFMTPMPNQNLTEDQARAVLEYIRHEAAEHGWGTERTGGSGGGQ